LRPVYATSTAGNRINWQSFGIAAGQTVQFVQPSRSAVALNRVTGAEPSAILGRLSANGQVFLVNPHGILFGPGASVDVGGLVASTLNIADADFMAGHYRFAGQSTADLLNQGRLQASEGGYVALLGTRVINQGQVLSPRGSVVLVAGQVMRLDVLGEQLLGVHVAQGVDDALLSNGGLMQADAGQVLMSTHAAGQWLGNAVNNTGVLQAQTVENRQGRIVLLGNMDSGSVHLSGTLDVSAGAGQNAGRVWATAHQVGVIGAHIKASGGAAGGQVSMGGGYQGSEPSLPHAHAVYMDANARIQANALAQGDGGQVVLWADGSTRARGQVSARGGAQGGNGGLIETSGQWLDVDGLKVDTRAPIGQTGTWLLDPADITISSASTTDATATGSVFAPNSGLNAVNINVADLVTALGTSNVTVRTANTGLSGAGSGDIAVNSAITWTAPTTLSLNAEGDVNVNQAITGTGGSLALNAGRNVVVDAATTTTTGRLAFTALQDVRLNAATTITTGELQAVAGGNVDVNAASSITTGNMVLRADNDGTGPGAAQGSVRITCGTHCLTVNTGQLRIRFNPENYASTSSETLAYANNLTGGGTLEAKAWVFGQGNNKVYDGLAAATLNGLMPDVTDAPPPVTLGSVGAASFDTPNVGTDKKITHTATFSNAAYELFATAQAPAGVYQARADITPQALVISAQNVNKVYGQSPALTEFVTSALVNGESVDSVHMSSAGQAATAGVAGSPYAIEASAATGNNFTPSNYSIGYVNGVLTVSPAALTVTAQNVNKVYGQSPALTEFVTSALVNGESVDSVHMSSAGQAATASVAGSPYAIAASAATGNNFTPSNYSIGYVNGVLTVSPSVVVPPTPEPELNDPEAQEPEPPIVIEPESPTEEQLEPPVTEPPVEEPPVTEPPVEEPPVTEPPVEEPPVTELPVKEPPVTELPVEESPVTELPATASPIEAPVTAKNDERLTPTLEDQALPKPLLRDQPPVLLTVSPPLPSAQGPVTGPQTPAPAPKPMPVVMPVVMPVMMPVMMPVVQEEPQRVLPKPVQDPGPLLPTRPPKQDRN
jgi:filamentous hemagglutinin family protein